MEDAHVVPLTHWLVLMSDLFIIIIAIILSFCIFEVGQENALAKHLNVHLVCLESTFDAIL